MSTNSETIFEAFLNKNDEQAWAQTIAELLPSIHEVDQAATRIWFAFFPLALARALQQAEDPEQLAAKLLMQGKYYLKGQIDSSHTFLYGHRYWPEVNRLSRSMLHHSRILMMLRWQIRYAKSPSKLQREEKFKNHCSSVSRQLPL